MCHTSSLDSLCMALLLCLTTVPLTSDFTFQQMTAKVFGRIYTTGSSFIERQFRIWHVLHLSWQHHRWRQQEESVSSIHQRRPAEADWSRREQTNYRLQHPQLHPGNQINGCKHLHSITNTH